MALLKTLRFILDHPLNRGARTAALWRFVRWQLGSRLLSGKMLLDWVEGARLIVGRGEAGLTGNIYCGLHDYAEMRYLLHVLQPDDVFVDVGANAGSYTVLASAVVGAHSYSFEPVPYTFARLMDNVRINAIEPLVSVHNVGVADRRSELLFSAGVDCENHVLQDDAEADQCVTVPVDTLDAMLAGVSPVVMKVDVEGYESFVLQGAQGVLADTSLHSVIMELNGSGQRYGVEDRELLAMMAAHDFLPGSYDPQTRRLAAMEDMAGFSGNVIFFRNQAVIEARLCNAESRIVGGKPL